MFKITINPINGNQYTWTLFAPNGIAICYGNLYSTYDEALHNANSFERHWNSPGSLVAIDAAFEQKYPMQPTPPKKPIFTLIKNEEESEGAV